MSILKEASYPFPDVTLRFLGTIVQNYRIIRGKETAAFQKWIASVEKTVAENLRPCLKHNDMLLPEQLYDRYKISNEHFTLEKISNFNSLIALSQQYSTPIYDLTAEQLNQQGVVLEQNQEKQKHFREVFSSLAEKIIGLISDYATCD
jgi:hypothetical protein